MTVEQATPRRRWRPRFSLLTLVLGVVFIGACGGLWWRWEPWYFDAPASCHLSAQTAEPVEDYEDLSTVAPDRTREVVCLDCAICSYSDGKPLFYYRWKGQYPGLPLGFLDNDTVIFDTSYVDSDETARLSYMIYSRRRPEYWWGIAWLPEFWVVLLSGGGLVAVAIRRLRSRRGS